MVCEVLRIADREGDWVITWQGLKVPLSLKFSPEGHWVTANDWLGQRSIGFLMPHYFGEFVEKNNVDLENNIPLSEAPNIFYFGEGVEFNENQVIVIGDDYVLPNGIAIIKNGEDSYTAIYPNGANEPIGASNLPSERRSGLAQTTERLGIPLEVADVAVTNYNIGISLAEFESTEEVPFFDPNMQLMSLDQPAKCLGPDCCCHLTEKLKSKPCFQKVSKEEEDNLRTLVILILGVGGKVSDPHIKEVLDALEENKCVEVRVMEWDSGLSQEELGKEIIKFIKANVDAKECCWCKVIVAAHSAGASALAKTFGTPEGNSLSGDVNTIHLIDPPLAAQAEPWQVPFVAIASWIPFTGVSQTHVDIASGPSGPYTQGPSGVTVVHHSARYSGHIPGAIPIEHLYSDHIKVIKDVLVQPNINKEDRDILPWCTKEPGLGIPHQGMPGTGQPGASGTKTPEKEPPITTTPGTEPGLGGCYLTPPTSPGREPYCQDYCTRPKRCNEACTECV